MKKPVLYSVWAVLFILCAGLGFIPEPTGAVRIFLNLLSVAFFIPPALVLYSGSRSDAALIRNLSALSLAITLVTLILNFVLVFRSQTLGDMLHSLLVVVSSPMICSGYWVLSLFLWACLLMVGLKKAK